MAAPGELRIEPAQGGRAALLYVRAQPGARRRGVLGLWNGHLKIGLESPPEDGRANEELIGVIARLSGLSRGDVRLLRGERSRNKELCLAASVDHVRARLLPLLERAR
jgi:uncharacterized protein (TIGR00251 family)